MLIQIGKLRGPVVTMWTLKGLLIGVSALVHVEVAFRREPIATHRAREGALTRVSALVYLQFRRCDKGHGAISTAIVLDAIVTLLVSTQSSTRHEGLVALGAHKGLLARVAAVVLHELVFKFRRIFASITSVLLPVIAVASASKRISYLHFLAYLSSFLFFIIIFIFLFLLHLDHKHGWWNGEGAHLTLFLTSNQSQIIRNFSYPNLRKLAEEYIYNSQTYEIFY